MTTVLFAEVIIRIVKSFLTNSGEEAAKKVGADAYTYIKSLIKRSEEKQVLANLEAEPLLEVNIDAFQKLLLDNLSTNNLLYKEMACLINATPTKAKIFELVLITMQKIVTELSATYNYWINASQDKKGEYLNRIEQLEAQLSVLEIKFYSLIR